MWIKVSTELRHSPKLYAIASHMNVTQVTALGAVCHAWMLADSHASENGFLEHLNFDSFDEMVGIERLGEAMNLVGWLEEVEGGLNFVNYAEHNGSTAKKRFEDAERQRKCRANKKAKKDAKKENQESVTPVTEARDKSVTREEKNRVYNIYSAYPKKKGKGAALKAIEKSLKKESYEFLLKRTQEYAESREGEEDQFTPYPATWFNREHYHDELSKPEKNEVKFKVLKGNNDWN